MHYIIYKTTNQLNGKYYIGCHQTKDLTDGYLGSGKHLIRAVKKYGIEYFTCKVLFSVSTKEEMFELEQKIVNEEVVNDPLSYNLRPGGRGGNPGTVGAFKGRKHSEETKEKISASRKNEPKKARKPHSQYTKDKISAAMKGKIFTQEHKNKLSAAHMKRPT